MVNKEENKITLNYYEEKLEVIKFKAQYIDNKKNIILNCLIIFLPYFFSYFGHCLINFFQIDYLFPFIAEIIEELTVDSNDIFFDYTLFKNHTGSTIGGFLELITTNKTKKKLINLPENNYDYIICVDRICEMKEIKLNFNESLKNEIKLISIEHKIDNKEIDQYINEEMEIEKLFEDEKTDSIKKKKSSI